LKNGNQLKNKALRTLVPRWASAPKLYVWVSTRERSGRFSHNYIAM